MSSTFEIPVVLFLFKRKETTLAIVERLRQVRPTKLYLLGDQGRDDAERALVMEVRTEVERAIDWDCEVIRNYADVNRGVYENIGLGAMWVFEREEWAIFLEDDNLPELTFFNYASELLQRYEDDDRIFWICGTNYFEAFRPSSGASYLFTQHLLPCGWASWASKFNRYYDKSMDALNVTDALQNIGLSYSSKALHRQQAVDFMAERSRGETERYISWDYHMAVSLRANSMLGVVPSENQIQNIGVDQFSEHGGTSFQFEMTKRLCGMGSRPLSLPLKHPERVQLDARFEQRMNDLLLLPWRDRLRSSLRLLVGRLFRVPITVSLTKEVFRKGATR